METLVVSIPSKFSEGRHAQVKKRVLSLNLNQIIGKIAHDENLALDKVQEYAKTYKEFLFIAAAYGEVSPSKEIDLVWHAHILDSFEYDKFCNTTFGFKVHHKPTYQKQEFHPSQQVVGEAQKRWQRTQRLFLQEFGYNPYASSITSGCKGITEEEEMNCVHEGGNLCGDK